VVCSRGRWRGGSVRGSPWHAYRVEPLSTERGPEAHLNSVKLTMPARLLLQILRMPQRRPPKAELADIAEHIVLHEPHSGDRAVPCLRLYLLRPSNPQPSRAASAYP